MKLVKFGLTLTVGVSAMALTAIAADKFPSKTIEVITHAGAGGGTDVNSRMMMLRGRRVLKADMVVVNKRGGNGAAAMNYFKTPPGRWPHHHDLHDRPRHHDGQGQDQPEGR